MRFICLIFVFIISVSRAEILEYSDKQGNVVYTDQHNDMTEPVRLSRTTIATQPDLSSSEPQLKSETDNKSIIQSPSYSSLNIVNIKDKQTFQNTRKIPIKITLEPQLISGDQVVLLFDGKSYASFVEAKKTFQALLDTPDRGEHTLQLQIQNSKGKILLETKKIIIYIHYAHLGTKN